MIPLIQLTDTQLVTIYQKNQDPIYFGELYNRYYTKVYHYCLGKLKDRDDAYDVTADTFLKLATKIEGLRNPELFIAWLFRVAINACVDKFRKKNKKAYAIDVNTYDLEDDVSGLEAFMLKEAQLDLLDKILDRLDIETKNLLVNKYCKGKSIQELEKEMGLSTSAVKMRLARGREKIISLWA